MARLETQINQIYLTHPETKKSSLILYEEQLTPAARLFVVAELRDLQKKSEANDLKKISEIILESFRAQKKLTGETLFETALSQINQNLADLAHDGHKSWVGKFSALIAIKSGDNIFLANNGQTSAWLYRQGEVLEILPAEKHGLHPLKSFVNFTQGKIRENDAAIFTTSNIFNFVSLELFTKLLSSLPLPDAAKEISKILQDSMSADQGFSAFFLKFEKKVTEEVMEPATPIYAPLPEESEISKTPWKMPAMPALPAVRLPKFNWPNKISLPKINLQNLPLSQWRQRYTNLSRAGKFFFISFAVFLLLFMGNLIIYGAKLKSQKTQESIVNQVNALNKDLTEIQSALIYKNTSEAMRILGQAQQDLATLQKSSPEQAQQFSEPLQTLKNQVDKVSVITDPKLFLELKHHPTFVNNTSIGFLFANQDSNSLSLFANNKLTDYFLLNSLQSGINGISYFPPAGVVVSAADNIYHIDTTLKQFEPVVNVKGGAVFQLRNYNNALYSLNTKSNQLVKTTFTKNKYVSTTINAGTLTEVRDFGLDKDVYLLFADRIVKVANNTPQAFSFPTLTDPITNATKIFVATNLYILETNKKRVVVLNKNGQLLNQIYLPQANTLLDLSVDEASRSLYLLDDNKLYQITL